MAFVYSSLSSKEAWRHTKAIRWFRRAAKQGYADAQYQLGVMYANGHGVRQDYAEAMRWYLKVVTAVQGDFDTHFADAQNNLGAMYANGEGVLQDYVQAHMWFNLGATRGNKKASKNRHIVAKRMTPADISKAQRLAREWLAKHGKK